jgi:hypothetical protein
VLGRIGIGLVLATAAVLSMAACGGGSPAAGACEPATYTACGCGCCGGATPVDRCLDTAAGETMQQIIDADQQAHQSAGCASAGCALPVRYRCCLTR